MTNYQEIKEKVISVTRKFASTTGDYAHLTKLTMEIKGFETKINSNYTKAGEYVFESIEAGSLSEDETLKGYCEKIRNFKKEINIRKEEIKDIRAHENKKENSDTDNVQNTDEGK